jgi:hypothetical protein
MFEQDFKNEVRISFRKDESSPIYKLGKVVKLKDGGFSLLAPYHSAKEGCAYKILLDYSKTGMLRVDKSDVQLFSARDKAKLSCHADGFVQVSGIDSSKITSGRDQFGKPKGLAIQVASFSEKLINTGPTCALGAWGLGSDFETESSVGSDRPEKDLLFCSADMHFKSLPAECNAVLFEFVLLTDKYWQAVRKTDEGFTLDVNYSNHEAASAVLHMRVLPFLTEGYLVAVLPSYVAAKFPSPSGWQISGPSRKIDGDKGEGINLHYPALPGDYAGSLSRSL